MKNFLTVLMSIVLICSMAHSVFADAANYDMAPAGYAVYVETPDGGLNMRHGPGTEYPKVMEDTIPDYTALYIEYVSGNWGYTTYNGKHGWVALKQTTQNPPSPLDVVKNKKVAGYYVYALTPDGGLNLRYGPGTSYAKTIDGVIPDYTKLYIEFTSNGWGYTEFMDYTGWVALNQTTTTPPPSDEPKTPSEEPISPKEEPQTQKTPQIGEEPPIPAEEPVVPEEPGEISGNNADIKASKTVPAQSTPVFQILLIASILLLTCTIAVIGILLLNKKTKR